jgi:hypothetical protein
MKKNLQNQNKPDSKIQIQTITDLNSTVLNIKGKTEQIIKIIKNNESFLSSENITLFLDNVRNLEERKHYFIARLLFTAEFKTQCTRRQKYLRNLATKISNLIQVETLMENSSTSRSLSFLNFDLMPKNKTMFLINSVLNKEILFNTEINNLISWLLSGKRRMFDKLLDSTTRIFGDYPKFFWND